MRSFGAYPKKGKEFAGEFISMLAGKEQTQHWAEEGNNELQSVLNFINGINSPKVDKAVKERLAERINRFIQAVGYAGNLSAQDPNNEVLLGQNLEAFETAFNQSVKKGGDSSDKTFSEDVSKLLNDLDHSIVDAPEVQALWSMVEMTTKAEGLAESKHAEIKLSELENRFSEFDRKEKNFEEKFQDVVTKMYKIDPKMTTFELDGNLEKARLNNEKAQGEFDAFKNPENAKLRQAKRRMVQDEVETRRRKIEDSRKRVSELRDKEKIMEKEGSYSFEELVLSGKKKFEDIQNNIDGNEKAIERLNSELADAENKNKLLKAAEEKLKKAQNKLDKVLKENDATENFEKFSSIVNKTNSATKALSLCEELFNESGEMYLALLDNGIIALSKNANKTVKAPGVTVTAEFLQRKELAQKYVQMRSAMIEASDNPKEAEAFFDEIENSTKCLKIMEFVHEKFVMPLNDVRKSGLEEQLKISNSTLLDGVSQITREEPKKEEKATISKFFSSLKGTNKLDPKDQAVIKNHAGDKLNFMSIETLPDLMSERDKAMEELKALKARIAVTRTPQKIKEEINGFKESIEEKKESRREITNNFLEHFELDPAEKELSFDELFTRCKDKLSSVKSEVASADNAFNQINLIKESEELNQMLYDVSEEKELKTARELGEKARLGKMVFDELTQLKKDRESLLDTYLELAEEQKEIKKDSKGIIEDNKFKHVVGELSSINNHISDAKRLVSHKNTEFFENMTTALNNTVNSLNNPLTSRADKIKQLEKLEEASRIYLEEKKKQRFVTNSAMRKDRIAKATLINNIVKDEIARQKALTESNSFDKVKASVAKQSLDTDMDESKFEAKFKKAQALFADAQKAKNGVSKGGNEAVKDNTVIVTSKKSGGISNNI